ncbi:MAG TPA: glycosyltransferase family 39 protein [Usitatibacteraceae bacterium]|nr:glycosyltransferase family 39 protein [Usitatibacteraceae bacterium]
MRTQPLSAPLVFDGHSTPVKSALFIVICAAWILTGLVGHDPWKSDEALTFGVVYQMLRSGDWLIPAIVDQPHTEYPPLYYWVSASLAWLFSPVLALHDGARLASGLFMLITVVYARKIAARLYDERAGRIAVLLLLGCLGLFLRGHEMNPELAGLAGMCMALYGLACVRSEPGRGGRYLGIGSAVIGLSIGIVPACFPLVIACAVLLALGELGQRTNLRGLVVASAILIAGICTFPLLLWASGQDLGTWAPALSGLPLAAGRRGTDITYFVSVLPWFAMPALPFALWLWWQERRRVRERFEIAMPLVAFVVLLVLLSLMRKGNDAVALVLLVPLSLAAAATPDRLPPGIARFMDWFGLVFFGLGIVAAWLYWIAAVTGIPPGAARAVARQVPGFSFSVSWTALFVAATLTALWAYAVVRAHRNNRRAIVNWTAGITLLWVLPNVLALAAFDHGRSYRGVTQALLERLPPERDCIYGVDLGDAQRALLHYFGSLRFAKVDGGRGCQALLTQGTRERIPETPPGWELTAEFSRPGDAVERLRLYLPVRSAEPGLEKSR